MDRAYRELLAFITKDVPSVLRLIAQSLADAKIPRGLNGWRGLSIEQWLRLAPLLSMAAVFFSLPFLLLRRYERADLAPAKWAKGKTQCGSVADDEEERNRAERKMDKDSYWLTRVRLRDKTGRETKYEKK